MSDSAKSVKKTKSTRGTGTVKTTKKAPVGKKIGKYQNAVLLAKGGMGAIYKADHPTLEQTVVLKMLTLTDNDQFIQRFQREATIMMGFQHENIANYFDHFKTTKSYCMVMEYVDGCSLAQLLEQHRYLDDDIALLVLRDTLRALAYAHAKGVVHRDIKPANILISSDGRVKLTDFGIAHDRAVDSDGLTRQGMTLGTPSYMAPEQFRDAAAVDGRADVYSAGVLLYESLSGRKPFAGATLPELLERIRKGRYERLGRVRPESTRLSRRLVRRAMRARTGWRFRDAAKMLRPVEARIARRNEAALRETLAGLVAGKVSKARPADRMRRRVKRILGITAASAAGLALLAVMWWGASLAAVLPTSLQPSFLGALAVEVPMPDDVSPRPGLSLEIFRRMDGDLLPVGRRRHGRISSPGGFPFLQSGDDGTVLRVMPSALRPGLYQAVVRLGDEIHTQAIRIPSLKDRSRALDGEGSSVTILSYVWEPDSSPVEIRWTVRRCDTGADLGNDAAVRIFDEQGGEYAPGEGSVVLNTGMNYDFTFRSPGYLERTVRVAADSGVAVNMVDVALLAEPAVLEISSGLPLRRPRLQGEVLYRHGGPEGGFRRVPMMGRNPRSLLLSPGRYTISYGDGEKEVVMTVDLEPGGTMSLALEKNDEKQLIWTEVDHE